MSASIILTDYQKVCEFNKSFDFPQYDNLENQSTLKLRLDLIDEEIQELQVAYESNDSIEEQDACADILYVAYGMAYTYKVDSDKYLDNFTDNFTSSDKTKTIFQNLKEAYNKSESIQQILKKIQDTFIMLKLACLNQEEKKYDWAHLLHKLIIQVYNFQIQRNYDSDRVFTIVHDSNMSKLCKSEEEAKLTVEKYYSDYKAGKSPYDTPFYYPLDNGMYVVKNKSTGKALKSINYVKVKL
jgi:predicted HAD superfamily Cof-like phosphohydrolase